MQLPDRQYNILLDSGIRVKFIVLRTKINGLVEVLYPNNVIVKINYIDNIASGEYIEYKKNKIIKIARIINGDILNNV